MAVRSTVHEREYVFVLVILQYPMQCSVFTTSIVTKPVLEPVGRVDDIHIDVGSDSCAGTAQVTFRSICIPTCIMLCRKVF